VQSHAAGWSDADIECYEREGYWQRLTLGQHLHQWAQRYGGRVALVEGDSRCSYAELDQRADRLAAGFTVLGVQHGDCVLLQLPNSIAFVVSLFALMRVGALPLLAMRSLLGLRSSLNGRNPASPVSLLATPDCRWGCGMRDAT